MILWLCDQGARIERLLEAQVASLSVAGVIDLSEVAQDGVRIRAYAGGGSFRGRKTLKRELAKAKTLLKRLSRQRDDDQPGPTGGPTGRQMRAARERAQRVEQALIALGEAEALRLKREKTHRAKTKTQGEPRASTSDPQARVMKMADGGFRPAYNIQFASLPGSGVVLALSRENVGSDAGLAEPMAQAQAMARAYGCRPVRHLVDGGYQHAPRRVADGGSDFGTTPPIVARPSGIGDTSPPGGGNLRRGARQRR